MSIEKLREERNRLLSECDWTQANDSPLSDTKKAEWKTYRQALRDITKDANPKLIDVPPHSVDPSSVTFPTKPS